MSAVTGTSYAGILGGVNAAMGIGTDFLRQASGGGAPPRDANPIRNVLSAALDDSTVRGLVRGAVGGVVGGGMAFLEHGGIEASVAGVTAAAATGFTPASVAAAAGAFFGTGGTEATARAVDAAIIGFTAGGGTAAVGRIVHETGSSIGGVVNDVRETLNL